ncbi:PTPRS [Mytilus edulis]|uniref:PTPRS n=1 Tax=Mytilus edulis TaxID=6550 RepID=A0A8S3TN65_MYTED|nr:PTPRS [Mytilus edulis]
MDDYSTKVLSWLGISMVTTYRILWVKLYKNIRQAEERNKRKRNENIKILNKLITNDTEALMNWMKDDQTDTTWMEPVTKHESITFQMVLLVDEFVTVTYRIIVLQNSTVDKEALLKWIGENVKKITVCNRDDNKVVTKLIRDNYSTLTDSIVNDKKTFISMIAEDHEKLDEKTKQDIKTLTEMNWLSSSNTALLEPECLSALNITSTTVKLKWDEPSGGTELIDFYQIICKKQSSSVPYFYETPRNACIFVVEGLKPNTEYAFKIQAINNGGK